MKKLFEEFKKFINRGNVVDMAIGVAVASAFTAIVTAFTNGFISPLLALLSGESTMADMKWVIKEEILEGETVVQSEVAILWGAFLQAAINFVIIALVLFLILKIVAVIHAHALKIQKEVHDHFSDEDEKQKEAEEKAKAEAEALARAEAEEKEEELRIAREKEAALEKFRQDEIALLTRISELLDSNTDKKQ